MHFLCVASRLPQAPGFFSCLSGHIFSVSPPVFLIVECPPVQPLDPRFQSPLSDCLHNIFTWMSHSHLKLNLLKTRFLILLHKPTCLQVPSCQLKAVSFSRCSNASSWNCLRQLSLSLALHIQSVQKSPICFNFKIYPKPQHLWLSLILLWFHYRIVFGFLQ